MQTIQNSLNKKILNSKESIIVIFKKAIPGFETIHEYELNSSLEDFPFMWLKSSQINDTKSITSFLLIDPFIIHLEYTPDILDEDLEDLKINSSKNVLILAIVNMKNQLHGITANLVGPIVINWKKKIAKQVIIKNHEKYSVQFPINFKN